LLKIWVGGWASEGRREEDVYLVKNVCDIREGDGLCVVSGLVSRNFFEKISG
jgi:hypothetical protein